MEQKLGSEGVTWDLTHLYRDLKDQNINSDIETIKSKISVFSTKYRGRIGVISPTELHSAVTEMEEIEQTSTRLASYAYLNFATQSKNPEAGAFLQKQKEIMSEFSKDMVFFELEWASLEDEKAATLLEDSALGKYRHYLTKLRKYRPHLLSETEEKLLAEISPVGASSWNNLFEKVVDRDEKINLLTVKLEEIFATVFRQIAMNRFEDAVHRDRRDNGELSPQRFGEHWINTQKEMFGNSVTLTENYSVWWSYIPHFLHAPGYVYAYAFAELLVLCLYKMYVEEGDSFVPKYLNLLASGGKDTPEKLLEDFGISLDDPRFWYEGLEIIDGMLKQVEELV